ncbi:MAG: LysE family translocator [Candidatus Omnitrophica bacterium]|nr:LysE family transporter [bacterium]MBV6481651.1 hypothetical protein [bacterium]MCL4735916.1 LysE family translocator [Candidatus Omnitrophota bacterium]
MPDFFGNPTLPNLFLGSFILGLSGAVAPGPVLVRTIAHVPRHGFLSGPLMIVGHSLLELALVASIGLGMGTVLAHPAFFIAIALIGGLVLFWMAVGMLRSLPTQTFQITPGSAAISGDTRGVVRDGILTSLANPYWSIWWATIGLSYLAIAGTAGFAGVCAFYIGHTFSDFTWYAFVSSLAAAGSQFMTDRIYRGLMAVCALALGLFGVLFVAAAVQRMGDGWIF